MVAQRKSIPQREYRRRRGELISEVVGRNAPPYLLHNLDNLIYTHTSKDFTRSNYRWWSYFRRGLQPGYELSSALAQPIINIMVSWTISEEPFIKTGNDELDEFFADFLNEQYNDLVRWFSDAAGLGDSYMLVNPDATIQLLSPETVEIKLWEASNEIESYMVRTRYEEITIEDEYFLDRREVTIISNEGRETTTYPNPLMRFPIVHLAWGREANEVYGHPVYAPLFTNFKRYHDLLNKSLDGIELMGNPVPVAEGLEDPEGSRKANATGTETTTNLEGDSIEDYVIDMDSKDMWWLGKGGVFKYASPGSFSGDARTMLKLLFLLAIEHCNIPEWAWGGAISSSKASVEAQTPAFIRTVEMWRRWFTPRLVEFLEIYYMTTQMMEPLPMVEVDEWEVDWSPIIAEDATIQLEKIKYLGSIGALSREEQLRLLDLVDDPAMAVEEADQEMEERADKFDMAVDQDLNGNNTGGRNSEEED